MNRDQMIEVMARAAENAIKAQPNQPYPYKKNEQLVPQVVAGDLTAIVDGEIDIGAMMTAALSAIEAAGLRVVPVEPTPELIGAWYRVKNGHHFADEQNPTDTSDYAAYRAMISATEV